MVVRKSVSLGLIAPGVAALSLLAAAPPAAAQLADLQPGRNFVSSPNFGTGRTQEIDAGDCDNDGDMDVAVANGGDGAAQQNRLYINNGGMQGGTIGTFTDETATRFAGVTIDSSRDIEFADIDADGDLDVLVANRGTSGGFAVGEPTRFYVNLGGPQGGTIGFYEERTNDHWGTLVSVPAGQQVLGGDAGPFRDWSCDCDFGDLDDDGDLDLFHSSYGPGINGTQDSRIFLNDGAGLFHELWPWANPAADTKTHTWDMDLADLDGDFDLDVLMSSRNSQARTYLNNLYDPVGSAPFHDITLAALIAPGVVQTGMANYACEYHDLDGDGDFDYWLDGFNSNFDRIARNDSEAIGPYFFTQMNGWIVGDPNQNEQGGDFIDYDGDGDVDVFVSNFSGTNWIYQSGLAQGLSEAQGFYHRANGGGSLAAAFPETSQFNNGGSSFDADVVDIDNDGDDDIVLANDHGQQNFLYTNVLGIPDVHAPTFYKVTDQADKPNGSPTVIHAAVRDNTSYYVMQFYDADLVYSVDGGAVQVVSMFAQGGMQYRGVIPAQADAVVDYHVEVTDLAGNTAVSSKLCYAQGAPPAGPWTDLGFALAGVSGDPALAGTGPLTSGSAGTLTLSNAAPSALTYLLVSTSSTPAPFKGGTLVPLPAMIATPIFTTPSGTIPLSWTSWPGGLSGSILYFQYGIKDTAAVMGVALSNALKACVP